MLNLRKNTSIGLFAFCFLLFCGGNVLAQKECRVTGATQLEFAIKNELKFDVEVKPLNRDCSEGAGLTVGANREIKVSSYAGQTYKVYENLTNRLLSEVQFKESELVYAISGFEPTETDPNERLCSRNGDPRQMSVRNATGKPVTIRFVTGDCQEKSGPSIQPGKGVTANTFVNNVFRAYDSVNGEYVSQFVIRPTLRNYVIGGDRDSIPSRSFLKTVNSIRAFSSIPPLELDETLNTTCKWFAEFMSNQDQDHAGHLVTDFTNDKEFRSMNTPMQRLRHFGWNNGKAADSAETTAVVRAEDRELIGAYFVMEWSSSTTHFMPFYDLYKTKFKKVGFAAVPSKKDPDLYYGCAIFAND